MFNRLLFYHYDVIHRLSLLVQKCGPVQAMVISLDVSGEVYGDQVGGVERQLSGQWEDQEISFQIAFDTDIFIEQILNIGIVLVKRKITFQL